MFARLEIQALVKNYGVEQFLEALFGISGNFQDSIAHGMIGYGDDESKDEGIAGMNLVQMSVEEVKRAIAKKDVSDEAHERLGSSN